MSAKNGLINNSQRKVFSEIAEDMLLKARELLEGRRRLMDNEVEDEIKKKMGIDLLEKIVREKEEELEELKRKVTDANNSVWIGGRYMGREVDVYKEKVNILFNEDLREISSKKSEAVAKIWASTETEEALKVLEELKEYLATYYKKVDEARPLIMKKLEALNIPKAKELEAISESV